jgi:hypothetical protein
VNRTHLLLGVVLVVLGAAYLLDDLGVLTVRVAVLGPVLLIAAGLALAASAAEDARH